MDSHLLRYKDDITFCFVDFETLNLCLSFCHNLPWQASVIMVKGNRIIEELDCFIKWNTKLTISAKAAQITHYSQDVVDQYGKPPEEVFEEIYNRFNNCDYIIGHNILGFDLFLIIEWCKLMKRPWKHFIGKIIDTNCLARAIKGSYPFKNGDDLIEYQYKVYHKRDKSIKSSLSLMAKELDIPFDPGMMHNAIYDLRINVQVFNKLKFMIDI
jgi:DNA polymerase III alpha subunit (gram-positive type)